MQFEALKRLMATNAERIRHLVSDISAEQAKWKPDPKSWSILEVINHLYDEEREDFRVRLDYILHRPDVEWPPTDPNGWVKARRYNERNLEESLEKFLFEREASLMWLSTLENPNWDTGVEAPFGTFHAGDMFVSWVTHDQLHMRQLIELQRAYLEKMAEPFDLGYAGDW